MSFSQSEILRKARQLRQREHRLSPSLKLHTLNEIQDFVRDRGIVSFLGGNELPSVINAILGREWKPSRKGFTGWYDWWSVKISGHNAGHALRQLDRADDIVSTRIFRKSKTLVSEGLWPDLDSIVKHHAKHAKKERILSELGWRILSLLKDGPVRTDRVRDRLGLKGKHNTSSFHRALSQLENYGLIVGYEDPKPERHLHANIWQLWETKVADKLRNKRPLSYDNAVAELVAKTLDATVLASEKDIAKWFPWKFPLSEVEKKLLDAGQVVRAGGFLVTARAV